MVSVIIPMSASASPVEILTLSDGTVKCIMTNSNGINIEFHMWKKCSNNTGGFIFTGKFRGHNILVNIKRLDNEIVEIYFNNDVIHEILLTDPHLIHENPNFSLQEKFCFKF